MRTKMIGKVTVLAAALFAASALSALAQEKNMTPLDIPMIGDMQALKVGDDAPAFKAKDTEGKDYAFSPREVRTCSSSGRSSANLAGPRCRSSKP